ncbi:MAG: hypothetical protein AB1813_22870 [Verrucomicrobiota bacterium]
MTRRLLVLSDIHYACDAERQRGNYEVDAIPQPLRRLAVRLYRHFIWLRHPFSHNHLVDRFIAGAGEADMVIANGDYSCDSAFIGVGDPASCQSARECLGKLRAGFGERFHATIGDHELGKVSLAGGAGGMHLKSWHVTQKDLRLRPFWRIEAGNYVLIGVTSSVIALPVFEVETLPEEREEWRCVRDEHLAEIRKVFASLKSNQRVLLFCHDPTALPFLGREEAVRDKLPQIEQTIIGHLHSELIYWQSRALAGIPPVHFLGRTVRRNTTALNQARHWRPFKVRLCRSLAGIELLKDGGYFEILLDEAGDSPAQFRWHRLSRTDAA